MFHGKEESNKYGFTNQYHAYQMGYDKKLDNEDGSKWFIGAAVTSYDGETNYVRQGKAEDSSIGLAIYGSYLGNKGHYLDIVARHSQLRSDLTSYAAGTGAKVTGDYHNWGSSFGVEYGRRVDLKHGYFVQPEAELTYGHTSGVSYDLSDGSNATQGSIDSWTARGGVRIGKQLDNGNVYASFSVLRDFGSDSQFAITDKYGASYSETTSLDDTWYELSIGGNVQLSDATYCYADIERSFGGDVETKWRYNVGVRYSF